MSNPTPRPMKATLITAPQFPLGTLYYVWKQSRHNRPLPFPMQIEHLLELGSAISLGRERGGGDPNGRSMYDSLEDNDHRLVGNCFLALQLVDKVEGERSVDLLVRVARHIRDEIQMILNESIPVTETLSFVFHLENIPISLREQLVRHRIGTSVDGRVGADIIPEPLRAGLLEMRVIPDLAESSWWSQTSRVIPFDTFYDEGRFRLPASLAGKTVTSTSPFDPFDQDAETFYHDCMKQIQEWYKMLQVAGVPIEDCRNLIPIGATHGITWTINLKALLHIFGKRSSWISQVGIWEEVMMQMAEQLVQKVNPMFRSVLQPQCIKKGKYVGCPVSGTNAERVAGVDGMPPCPLWVWHEPEKALAAFNGAVVGEFPGRDYAAWQPPVEPGVHALGDFDEGKVIREGEVSEGNRDIRNWTTERPVEKQMLHDNAKLFSRMWGFNIFEGVPSSTL